MNWGFIIYLSYHHIVYLSHVIIYVITFVVIKYNEMCVDIFVILNVYKTIGYIYILCTFFYFKLFI